MRANCYTKEHRKDVLAHCSASQRETLSEEGAMPEVVKMGDIVVKHGNVNVAEAANQHKAYELLDPAILQVPRVLDFFIIEEDEGYLVMEYIVGSETDFTNSNVVRVVAQALKHMHTFRGPLLGPVSGGDWKGLLWEDQGRISFEKVEDFEQHLNGRLLDCAPGFQLSSGDLCFSHLDVAPRNIIMTPSGVPCLLDWASAGYYPRFMELCACRINAAGDQADDVFHRSLEADLENELGNAGDKVSLAHADAMMKVLDNSIRFSL